MPYKMSKDVCATCSNQNTSSKSSVQYNNQVVKKGQVTANICPKKNYHVTDINGNPLPEYAFQLHGVT